MLTSRAAAVIRLAREDAGMTQKALAEALGIQQPTISAYESGRKRPRAVTLQAIVTAARGRPSVPLSVYASEIRAAAASAGLHDVRVFGSAVRGTDSPSSDIDLLVSATEVTTLFDLAGFAAQVKDITGFDVDVVTDRQIAGADFQHVRDEAIRL